MEQVPGLRIIAAALIQSVINLRDVAILALFSMLIFALIGLQLFMGRLRQRCVNLNFFHDTNNHVNETEIRMFHGQIYTLNHNDTSLLDLYHGSYHSDGTYTDALNSSCLANVSNREDFPILPVPKRFILEDIKGFCKDLCSWCEGTGEQDPYKCVLVDHNPNYGFTNFDYIGWSMLSAFRLMTQDYWENLYQMSMKTSESWMVVYFFIAIFYLSFYIINLTLAIVAMAYNNQQKEHQELLDRIADEEERRLGEMYSDLKKDRRRDRMRNLLPSSVGDTARSSSRSRSSTDEAKGSDAKSIQRQISKRVTRGRSGGDLDVALNVVSNTAAALLRLQSQERSQSQQQLQRDTDSGFPYADEDVQSTPTSGEGRFSRQSLESPVENENPPVDGSSGSCSSSGGEKQDVDGRKKEDGEHHDDTMVDVDEDIFESEMLAKDAGDLSNGIALDGMIVEAGVNDGYDTTRRRNSSRRRNGEKIAGGSDSSTSTEKRVDDAEGHRRSHSRSNLMMMTRKDQSSRQRRSSEENDDSSASPPHASRLRTNLSTPQDEDIARVREMARRRMAREAWISRVNAAVDFCCVWECSPGWINFQGYLEWFIMDPFVDLFITICILLNTVCMSLDREGIDPKNEERLEYANTVFTIIFAAEALLKIVALSPKQYFAEIWNRFDSLIAAMSVAELILEYFFEDLFSGKRDLD